MSRLRCPRASHAGDQAFTEPPARANRRRSLDGAAALHRAGRSSSPAGGIAAFLAAGSAQSDAREDLFRPSRAARASRTTSALLDTLSLVGFAGRARPSGG